MKSLFFHSAALAALLGSPAIAQDVPLSAPASDAPEIIVTATGAQTGRDQTGQAVSLLSAAVLETRQVVSIADLLATVPGLSVTQNGPLGGFSAVRIRGAEGEQTLALIDGVKVNDPSSPGGGFDFGSLLSGTIDRIEVLRGPNSVPWGSQAIGGVVNIITARPRDGLSGDARVDYGYGDATHIVGNLSGGSATLRGSIGGGWFSQDGISAFKNGSETDGMRQYATNGRVEIDLTPGVRIDLRGWYAHSRIEQDGSPPPDYSFTDTPEVLLAQQIIGYAGLSAQTGGLANRLAVTLSDINRDSFAAPQDAVPQYLNHGRTERLEYRGDWTINARARAVFGAEQEWTRANDGYSVQKTHQTSGYAQFLFDPLSSVTLTGGARVDDHPSFGRDTTVSGNVAWRASGTTTIRAAYGEGFKAPTLFQLYSYYGNAALRAETAKSYDLGVEQRLLDGSVRFSTTVFLRNTRDQVDFISCAGPKTGLCEDRPDGTYDNIDATRAKGIETTVDIRPTDQINISISHTLLKATDRSTGDHLIRRPKHSLSADVDWQSFSGARLGLNVRLASDSMDTDFETFSPTELNGYTLVGLRASLPVGTGLEIFGRIENLFDTRYETVSGYGTYGRNAHAGVRARF